DAAARWPFSFGGPSISTSGGRVQRARRWRSATIRRTRSSAACRDPRATNPCTTITTSTGGRRRTAVKLLVDTSAILALILRDDRNHARAAKFLRSHPQVRFVWTELILAEVATRLRTHAGAERAVAVVRELLRSRRSELLLPHTELLQPAPHPLPPLHTP